MFRRTRYAAIACRHRRTCCNYFGAHGYLMRMSRQVGVFTRPPSDQTVRRDLEEGARLAIFNCEGLTVSFMTIPRFPLVAAACDGKSIGFGDFLFDLTQGSTRIREGQA